MPSISPQDSKSNSKKYRYSEKYGKKILHIFDEPFYGLEEIDKCTTVTVSIPISLKDELMKYTNEMGIPVSRYIRILIQQDLGIRYRIK